MGFYLTIPQSRSTSLPGQRVQWKQGPSCQEDWLQLAWWLPTPTCPPLLEGRQVLPHTLATGPSEGPWGKRERSLPYPPRALPVLESLAIIEATCEGLSHKRPGRGRPEGVARSQHRSLRTQGLLPAWPLLPRRWLWGAQESRVGWRTLLSRGREPRGANLVT